MPKYRKRPVVIEATQWHKNGDHPLDYGRDITDPLSDTVWTAEHRKEHGWEGDVVRYFRHPDLDGASQCKHCGRVHHEHGWIDTLEGGHIVCPGDWIITGVKGEHYPCKPDIFAATYEAVEENSPLSAPSPTMTNTREQEKEVEEKLIEMLQDRAVFISGQLDTLCVNCNDMFYWACADAENIALADLDEVYRHFKADTLEEWCCLRRGMRPQRPLITRLKERGKWSAALEALPERTDA